MSGLAGLAALCGGLDQTRPASTMTEYGPDTGSGRLPEHETTYRRLRDMLLFGALAPGQKVTIQGLVADLGAGMTPVREAIRRLTAEGALEPQGNRRVLVPRPCPALIEELTFARLAIEPELARRACARMGAGQIERLAAIDRQVDAAIARDDVPAYLQGNFDFHFTLYDAAAAPVLRSLAQALWLRSGPSLRAVIETGGGQIGPDRHHEALEALTRGDAEALARAIADDIRQGLGRISAQVGQQPVDQEQTGQHS